MVPAGSGVLLTMCYFWLVLIVNTDVYIMYCNNGTYVCTFLDEYFTVRGAGYWFPPQAYKIRIARYEAWQSVF